jgi:hypothetical protein
VVQEQLGQEAQVLAVHGILGSVDLEHRDLVLLIAVDLVTGWVEQRAAFAVAFEFLVECEELEAELTEVEAVDIMVIGGVG